MDRERLARWGLLDGKRATTHWQYLGELGKHAGVGVETDATTFQEQEWRRVVAAAVMRAASDEGVGDSLEDSEIESRIDAAFWDPRYRRYVAA